jgi:CRP/FNR family cyclic AMP-dependent transcriptional regulator
MNAPDSTGLPDDFLGRLTDDDQASFLKRASSRPMVKGDVLFLEGQEADEVLVIGEGIVKVWLTASSGRTLILNVIDAGSLLGELSSIDGTPRSAGATALTDGTLWSMPKDSFHTLLEERPAIALEILRTVAARLRGASRRQLEFSAGDTLGRLSGSLLDLGERYGMTRDGVLEVVLPMGQGELGAWGGLSREAVVKGLRALRGLGWIEVEGRHVRLLDPRALRDRAHRPPTQRS